MSGAFGAAEVKKPLSLACYICGRDFGTTSLEIHHAQCLKKRDAAQIIVRDVIEFG